MYLKQLIIIFITLSSSEIFTKTYSWEDLQILANEKNYSEFFEHARDLVPSKRGPEWRKTVQKMGQSYLRELTTKENILKEEIKGIKSLINWPIFSRNEFFTAELDKLLLKQIRVCIKLVKPNCEEIAFDYLKNFEHDINFSFYFLKAIQPLKVHSEKQWRVAAIFIQDKFSEFYCAKSPLKQIILSKIKNNPAGKLISIHNDCIKKIELELYKYSKEGNKHALSLMNKHKILTQQQKNLIALIHFLNKKKLTKRSIDVVISILKKLEKSPEQRAVTVEELSQLDPLPGRIFRQKTSASLSKTKMLERHIPEFLDLYAKTCLAYLEGSTNFPKGNPTPDCHGFFSLALNIKTIPKSYLNKYKKATYFKPKT